MSGTDVDDESNMNVSANLSIHVGTIEVHLSSMLVHESTEVINLLLKYPKRRRVCDHDRRELVRVLLNLREQVVVVDLQTIRRGVCEVVRRQAEGGASPR